MMAQKTIEITYNKNDYIMFYCRNSRNPNPRWFGYSISTLLDNFISDLPNCKAGQSVWYCQHVLENGFVRKID